VSQKQRDALNDLVRNGPLDIGGDPAQQREVFLRMFTDHPLPGDVVTAPGELGGIPTLEIAIENVASDNVVLYFHGGFYVLGSPATSAALSADIARRTETRVVSVDYRLAPEHPYPAALQDAIAAYRRLLDAGIPAARIAFVGESAGAGLAAATLASLAGEQLAQPACAVLFSPYADLTLSGPSMTGKASVDPAFTASEVAVRAADYVGAADPTDGFISPIFADLTGLPPLLIQVGTYEILLDDALRLAARAAADDVAVTLEATPGVPHIFQGFAAMLDEGEVAMRSVAAFLRAHLGLAAT
jgi:acetyl esterase/lipase